MKQMIALVTMAIVGCGGAPPRSEALRDHAAIRGSKRILLFFYATNGPAAASDRARKVMRNPETLDVVRRYFEYVPVDTGERRNFALWSEGEPERKLVEYFRSKGVHNAKLVVAYGATPPLLVVTNAEGQILAEHEFSGTESDLRRWLHLHGG